MKNWSQILQKQCKERVIPRWAWLRSCGCRVAVLVGAAGKEKESSRGWCARRALARLARALFPHQPRLW
jgi:hypothetical protein